MMATVRTALAVALALATTLAAPASGAASALPEACLFRIRVAWCEATVTGVITDTAVIPVTRRDLAPNRISRLVVDEVVFGPCQAGDTLQVVWTACEAVGVDSGVPPAAVDTWTGARMLWLLQLQDDKWAPLDPVPLADRDPEVLRERLSWLRHPAPCDSLIAGSEAVPPGPPLSEAVHVSSKLGCLADWIERSLEQSARNGAQ